MSNVTGNIERWYPVSKRPEVARGVLVWHSASGCMFTASWDGENWLAWTKLVGQEELLKFKPSHWRYLPKPPRTRKRS